MLQKFLSVLLIPIYTRYLDPSEYGIIALLGILTLVISTLTMCGLANGIARYFFYTEEENVTKAEVIWSPLCLVLFITTIVVAVMTYYAESLSNLLFNTGSHRYLIILTLANIFISNISYIGRSVLVCEERVMAINIINIIGVFVGVSAGLTLVVYLGRGIEGVVEAGLIGSASMALVSICITLQGYAPAFNATILKKQLRYSLPLVAAVFAFVFIDSSDRYLLKLYLPLSEVGLYNIGYQAGMLVMIFVGGFNAAWGPYYHKHNLRGEGQAVCNRVLHMILPVAGLLAVLFSLVAPLAVRFMLPETYREAYTVVPFVTLAYMLKVPYVIFLTGVQMKNKTDWQLYLECSAAATNIGMNILLIPIIGREAAAATTLLSYGVMVTGSYFMAQSVNPIPGLSLSKTLAAMLLAGIFSCVSLIPGYEAVVVWACPAALLVFMFLLMLIYFRDIQAVISGFRAQGGTNLDI